MVRTLPTTQSRHPWRAVTRTVFATLVGLLPLVPEILAGAHLGSTATGAQTIAIAGAITRLLARPDVEALLHRVAPWLAAQPDPALTPPTMPADKTLMR